MSSFVRARGVLQPMFPDAGPSSSCASVFAFGVHDIVHDFRLTAVTRPAMPASSQRDNHTQIYASRPSINPERFLVTHYCLNFQSSSPFAKVSRPLFKLFQTLLAHARTDTVKTGLKILHADRPDLIHRCVQQSFAQVPQRSHGGVLGQRRYV